MEHADRGCGRPRSRRPCPGSRGSAPRRRRRRRRRDRAGWSLRMLLIGKRVDLSEVILSDALSRRQVWIAYISPPRPTCAAAARGGPLKHRIRASRHGSLAATAGLLRRDVASAVGVRKFGRTPQNIQFAGKTNLRTPHAELSGARRLMVRRGSTVQVRQRALTLKRPAQWPFSCLCIRPAGAAGSQKPVPSVAGAPRSTEACCYAEYLHRRAGSDRTPVGTAPRSVWRQPPGALA